MPRIGIASRARLFKDCLYLEIQITCFGEHNVRKTLLSTLALLGMLLSSPSAPAQGQPSGPVVVVSLSGLKAIRGDVAYFLELAGAKKFADQAMASMDQLFSGVDESKPWGLAVSIGQPVSAAVFVPTKDIGGLLKTISAIAAQTGQNLQISERGTGKWQISALGQGAVAVQKGDWALIAQSEDQLAGIPADPSTLLGTLPTDYDIAIQANVQNIPTFYRDLAVNLIKQGASQGTRPQPGETPEAFQLRKQLMEAQLALITEGIKSIDKVILGAKVDEDGRIAFIDFGFTAIPGSEAAKEFSEEITAVTSKMVGLSSLDATAMLHFSAKIDTKELGDINQIKAAMEQQALAAIDRSSELKRDPKARQFAEELTKDLIAIMVATMQEGMISGGAAIYGDGPFMGVLGFNVADGAQVEKLLDKIIEVGKQAPNFPNVTKNAAEYQQVRFHNFTLPSQGDPRVQTIFGGDIEVNFGIGPKSFFLAVGSNGRDAIKKVIDRNQQMANEEVAPFLMGVALGPIMTFAQKAGANDRETTAFANALRGSAGNDHITLTVKGIENGFAYRIQAEEGILRALAQLSMQAANLRAAPAGK